jgi:pyridinium-3,5-bisthiocarboxylic acid mononucleotide nickel chelatase
VSHVSHIHLDPLGGIAGDMFLAAVLDAKPELAGGTLAAMRRAGLPESWHLALEAHGDGTLAGQRLRIEPPDSAANRAAGPGTRYIEIRERIAVADLPGAVRQRAGDIFARLAEAEGAVHGVSLEDVHFHELAAWDSIADIVGAAWLIEALGETSWSCGPLPKGGGRIATEHGTLPVPAPAAARLLQGFAMIDDGIGGERVTPTGAAILGHLVPAERLPPGSWRLAASGTGFGSRRLQGIPNLLRVLAYQPAASGRIDEQVAVVSFEVDDQSPEDLALGLDTLRRVDGVLDVVQMPVVGKKGRLAAHVRVLAVPERLDVAIEACFIETTTIGLRWRIEARAVMRREAVSVHGPGGEIGVKVVRRPNGKRTAKAEIGALGQAGGGQGGRTRLRRAAEASALDAIEEEADGLEGG